MQDTYVLKEINIGVSEILDQKAQNLNPGARIVIKNALADGSPAEEVETRININHIEMVKTGYYRFTGILSMDTRIGNYFYPDECQIEGFLAADMSHEFGLPILLSTQGRYPREHKSMRERRMEMPKDALKNAHFIHGVH